MKVGRSAPRHQSMAFLYPRSKNLQSHASEYFIVVVRLCHRLLKITQKSTIGQFTATLSDADLKNYQSELNLWANSIKEEESLLLAKSIEEEAQENSRFRALSSKFFESISLQQKLKRNLRVLNFCSLYDYETTWKQTRKSGNATLFNRTMEYQDWKERAGSCTLLYTGKPGSGKSVLLANIVDDLHLSVRSKVITIAYFFCRHDIPESLKARTVIGSLAKQLLYPISDLAKAAEVLNETILAHDCEGIFRLLKRALPPDYKAYFILDGLDECDYTERELLIQQLRNLQQAFTILLCVSLRLQPNNASKLSSKEFTAARVVLFPDDNPDIEEFVRVELTSCIERKKLVVGNPVLILEIQDALLKGSQGMFLWVALQIESLCVMKTDNTIRQALQDLPKDLPETFSRILQRSEGLGKPYQQRILEFIIAARRPLTTEELREALSVVPGDAVWNSQRLLNDVFSTLACCGGPLIFDEEERTIRLVHHSDKQFLLSGLKDTTHIGFTTDIANRKMAAVIITYLNYNVFNTQLSIMVVSQIMTGSAPSSIIRSTDSSGIVRSLALRLLKSRTTPDYDIGKTLAETSKLFRTRLKDEFHFYSYAKPYFLQHIFYLSEHEPVIYDLLLKLCRGNIMDMSATDEDGQTTLLLAVRRRHEAIVKVLLDSGKVDTNLKDNEGQAPLWWALRRRHKAIIKVLLDSGKVDTNLKDNEGQTPLWWAVRNGHEAIVKVLLDSCKVDFEPKE